MALYEDTLTIFGSSDDLIEIEGTINEEFSLPSSEEAFIAISNGTVVRIQYTDHGVWRIALVSKPGDVAISITPAPENDGDNYSDVCVISGGNIAWVVLGSAVLRA